MTKKKQAPALRQPTKLQMALVDNIILHGGSVKANAERAGYSISNGQCPSAYQALHTTHVQAYMHKRVHEMIGIGSGTALATVLKLIDNAKSEYVRLEASKDILDRAGFKPVDRQQSQMLGDIRVKIDLG